MRWTEVIKNYPLIQTYYRKKIAAKRRMKASSGLDESLNDKDMRQLTTDIIKVMKENLPDDVEKPATYDDVVNGLKSGGVGVMLGFKPNDLNATPAPQQDVEEEYGDIEYQVKPTEEVKTEEMNPPVGIENLLGEDELENKVEPEPQPIPAPMPRLPSNIPPRPVAPPPRSPQAGNFWGDTPFWGDTKIW